MVLRIFKIQLEPSIWSTQGCEIIELLVIYFSADINDNLPTLCKLETFRHFCMYSSQVVGQKKSHTLEISENSIFKHPWILSDRNLNKS